MDEKDLKAVKQALRLSIDSTASNLALYNSLLKLGIVIDDEFYKSEKKRLIEELSTAVYSEINK